VFNEKFKEGLSALKNVASDVVKTAPESDWLPLLRHAAGTIGIELDIRDGELRRYLAEARGDQVGIATPRMQGEVIDTTPTPWAWEGVLMAGAMNLLVAPPKVGKSALTIGMVAAWARGQGNYLGHALHGPCPNVYIVGTDQPENDWFTLLAREGLVGEGSTLADPIKMLWSSGCPLHLSQDGIRHLAYLAAEDPGALFLIDSYHACISPLGIDEATSAFDGPARALQGALAPHHATIALIHHTNKSVAGGNATNASRGSNALPAAASLNILMNWLRPPAEGQTQADYRVIVKTQGRAKGTSLIIELTDNGWVQHGDGEIALQAEALADAEAELAGQQADIFDYVMTRWENGANPVTISELAGHLNRETKKVDRVVRALMRKGLLRKAGELPPSLDGGRPAHLFAPTVVGEYPPPSEMGGKPEETGKTPSRVQKETIKPPLPPKPTDFLGGGVFPPEGGLPPANSPVELLTDGVWLNGWHLHSDTTDTHHVVAWKQLRSGPYHKRNLRWGVDARLCQPSSDPLDFDPSSCDF
jgi:hypothetical protein